MAFLLLWIGGWNDRSRTFERDRLSRNPAVWIGVGVPPDFLWNGGFWVNGFVGKARCPLLETQRHQQVLIAEGVKHDDLGHRLREQLHRDSFGFKAFHILG